MKLVAGSTACRRAQWPAPYEQMCPEQHHFHLNPPHHHLFGDVLWWLRGLLSTTAQDLRGRRQLFIIITVTAFLSVLTGLGLHDGPVRRRSEGG